MQFRTRPWWSRGSVAGFVGAVGVAVMLGSGLEPVRADVDEAQALDSLEVLQAMALAQNPEVLAARARWRAARHRIPQASALPDPEAGYMIMGDMVETRTGPQEEVFELEQMVPFPGKLWQRHRMAVAEGQMAEAQLRATELDVMLTVSEVYYDLYAVHATQRVVGETRDVLRKVERVAEARYASGRGSQRDVAKAQAEVSETLQRLFVLEQQREALTARLNALLDRAPFTSVGRVADPSAPRGPTLAVEELLELAREHRPELTEAQAFLTRERHAKRLATLAYVPDLSVGFQYIQVGSGDTTDPNDGEDAWMIPLKFTIPLWQNRLIPGVLEADGALAAGEAGYEEAVNRLEYEVREAHARFTAARQVVELYEHALLPQAELAFRSDQAGYEAGRADVLDLLDSERVYLNAKIGSHQALAEAWKSYAALERAVGTGVAAGEE